MRDHADGVQAKFAAKYDFDKGHISQLITRNRDIGDKLARKFEAKFGLEYGAMDRERGAKQKALDEDERALIEAYREASPSHRTAVRNLLHAITRDADGDLTIKPKWDGDERRSGDQDN